MNDCHSTILLVNFFPETEALFSFTRTCSRGQDMMRIKPLSRTRRTKKVPCDATYEVRSIWIHWLADEASKSGGLAHRQNVAKATQTGGSSQEGRRAEEPAAA